MTQTAIPTITADPKATCSVAKFGRPHLWTTGAFYWPLGASENVSLYVGEDYVMCGACGQIERDA